MSSISLYIIYGLPSLAFLVLGTVILLGQRADTTKRFFAAVCYLFGAWSFMLLLTDMSTQSGNRLLLLRTALLFGNIIPLLFYLFCLRFTGLKARWSTILGVGIAVALTLFTYSDIMIKSIKPGIGSQPDAIGPLYQLQSLYTAAYFLAGVVTLVIGTKHNTIKRNQVRLMGSGLVVSVTINIVTGFILVAAGAGEKVGLVGPPAMLIFIGSIYYAIAKYRVFDVRPYIARTTGFIISMGTILGLIVGLRTFLIDNITDGTTRAIADGVSLIGIVLLYPHIARRFQRLTHRVFFRAYYDPATALNEATAMMAYEKSLATLAQKSVRFLCKLMDVNGAAVYIPSGKYSERIYRAYGLPDIKQTMFVAATDQFGTSPEWIHHEQLQASFPQLDSLETVIPLGGPRDRQGYLAIGLKRSGTPPDDRDYRFISVFAHSLTLAIQNARSYEETKEFANVLTAEVERATKQLKRTNQNLRSVSAAKDEFMSMAAHQLRPQLTATQGFVELMLRGGGGSLSGEQQEILNLSRSSVTRMIRLVNDMLNAVRFTSGSFTLDTTNIDLTAVLAREVKDLQFLSQKRGVQLDYRPPQQPITIQGDEIKLREVILNLIDNAINYSQDNSTVVIRMTADMSHVSLTVTDTGIGVPKEAQKRLFSKFFRAGNAQTIRPAGTGVGLFVAKKVVTAHGGTMIYQDRGGKGSVFGFRLPLRTPR